LDGGIEEAASVLMKIAAEVEGCDELYLWIMENTLCIEFFDLRAL